MEIRQPTFNDLLYQRREGWLPTQFREGKPKSTERQLELLKRGQVYCHCVGGMAMKDPDLKKLVSRGLMKFERRAYSRGWGGNYMLSRTVATITPKGEALLCSLKQE